MDGTRFDTFIQSLQTEAPRRTTLGLLLGGALGLAGRAESGAKKRKKRQKPKFNEFGCVNVGGFCQENGQCCSGICEAKQCRAHDVSTCRTGQTTDFCGGADVVCTTSSDEEGQCHTTTGRAPFCAASGNCFACNNDSDCIDVCGLDAACVACEGCPETGGTGCLGVATDSCSI